MSFASLRSIREALGFMGAGRAHDAQTIADTGADLTVESPIRHRTDRPR